MNTTVHAAVEGPSFPIATKVMAVAAVVMTVGLGWGARAELAAMRPPPELLMLACLAGAVVLWQLALILFSRTCITNDALSQGWLWQSRVPLAEITQVKLLRVKALDSVIAPRLVVRAGATGSRTFHIADPKVLAVVDAFVHGNVSGDGA